MTNTYSPLPETEVKLIELQLELGLISEEEALTKMFSDKNRPESIWTVIELNGQAI